jgi:hypothetical protein
VTREFILNNFNELSEANPGLAVKEMEDLTGEFCGLSASE